MTTLTSCQTKARTYMVNYLQGWWYMAKQDFSVKALRFMHKEVKFKGTSGSWLSVLLSCKSHNSGNFHPDEKNKISKSKLGSPLSNTKDILEIKQKAFVLLLINHKTFLGHPV